MDRTNWAGNLTYRAPRLAEARTVAEVQALVADARRIRALGSRHSFNRMADSDDLQLSLRPMNRVLDIDAEAGRVTVEGGILYGELAPELHARGLALANLASLPHISVAGAAMTATHGSGSATGNLATQIVAMDVVSPAGDVVTIDREAEADLFRAAAVGLGVFGPIVALTLEVEPAHEVAQTVYTGLSHHALAAEFDAIFGLARSVSVFTDWRGEATTALWLKRRVDAGSGPAPDSVLGARPATRAMHPLPGADAADCTEQFGRPGPWHERLPHFRMGFTPSSGAEIQAEFFLPREAAPRAIALLRRHADRLAPILMISEIRTIAGDDLWMSPCYRGPQVGLHFTFLRDWEAIRTVLEAIEADLAPLGAVPHWGKVTTMGPGQVRPRYQQMARFRELARDLDPDGKFRNAHVDRMIFDEV